MAIQPFMRPTRRSCRATSRWWTTRSRKSGVDLEGQGVTRGALVAPAGAVGAVQLRAHAYRPGRSICFVTDGPKPREVLFAFTLPSLKRSTDCSGR
jgi:hypothetical protein